MKITTQYLLLMVGFAILPLFSNKIWIDITSYVMWLGAFIGHIYWMRFEIQERKEITKIMKKLTKSLKRSDIKKVLDKDVRDILKKKD